VHVLWYLHGIIGFRNLYILLFCFGCNIIGITNSTKTSSGTELNSFP
jgi:hypothetical protein